MASAEGYARPSRFAIRLFPPTNLEINSNCKIYVEREGTKFDPSSRFRGTMRYILNSLTILLVDK